MEKVIFEGKEYKLEQEAYSTNYRGYTRYEALATDENGNRYIVAWDTTEEWDEEQAKPMEDRAAWADDENWACDWEHPVDVKMI